MAIIFAVRGTQMNAYYSTFASQWGSAYGGAGGTAIPVLTADNSAGIFGGSYIAKAATVARTLIYPGFTNCPSTNTFSLLMRIIPRWTGNPAGIEHLFMMCSPSANGVCKMEIMIDTAGKIRVRTTDQAGVGLTLITGTVAFNPTSGTPVDIMFAWNGTTTAGAFKISVDGVQLDTLTVSTITAAAPTSPLVRTAITMGHGIDTQRANWDLNELILWDSAENHVYATRTGFTTVSNAEGYPAVGVVQTGVVYPQLGSWSTQTGTYDGSDRWTDPGQANVRNATAYKANSTSNNKTGTLIPAEDLWLVPTSSISTAGTFGKLIKDNIDAAISAVKAKTDNLPSDPADASDIAASFATVNTKLDTIDDYVDSEVAAIKAKTDNLPASPASSGDVTSATSTIVANDNSNTTDIISEISTDAGAVAAAVWNENLSGHTDASKFGGFVKKLLTLANFLGLQ